MRWAAAQVGSVGRPALVERLAQASALEEDVTHPGQLDPGLDEAQEVALLGTDAGEGVEDLHPLLGQLRDLLGRVPLEVGASAFQERLSAKLGEVLLDSSP